MCHNATHREGEIEHVIVCENIVLESRPNNLGILTIYRYFKHCHFLHRYKSVRTIIAEGDISVEDVRLCKSFDISE